MQPLFKRGSENGWNKLRKRTYSSWSESISCRKGKSALKVGLEGRAFQAHTPLPYRCEKQIMIEWLHTYQYPIPFLIFYWLMSIDKYSEDPHPFISSLPLPWLPRVLHYAMIGLHQPIPSYHWELEMEPIRIWGFESTLTWKSVTESED
jgi:hypothetical protein